jgi:hypothetical protein
LGFAGFLTVKSWNVQEKQWSIPVAGSKPGDFAGGLGCIGLFCGGPFGFA